MKNITVVDIKSLVISASSFSYQGTYDELQQLHRMYTMQAGSYVMIDQYIGLFLYWGADLLV